MHLTIYITNGEVVDLVKLALAIRMSKGNLCDPPPFPWEQSAPFIGPKYSQESKSNCATSLRSPGKRSNTSKMEIHWYLNLRTGMVIPPKRRGQNPPPPPPPPPRPTPRGQPRLKTTTRSNKNQNRGGETREVKEIYTR